jgi:transcriptional regulator with XRE-family HTH domain
MSQGGNPRDSPRTTSERKATSHGHCTPVRRRLVGRALRRYRDNLGYTLKDAARILDCDASKVSRIETGGRSIRAKELRELLTEYGIDGEQLDILTLLADPRGAFGWYRDYADVLPGAWQDYVILEAAAAKVSVYEAQRVPGLLQTRGYARALAETDPALRDDAERDRAVEAAMARQQAVLDERRPGVHLVIGQAALHQQVGSPEVMEEQLRQVARIAADSGTVTVQVLPFDSGAHAAAGDGAFSILQVTGTGDWDSCTWAGSPGECAWRAGATWSLMRRCSTSCARSRTAPRSQRCWQPRPGGERCNQRPDLR